MTFEEFSRAKGSPRATWLREAGLSLYVRRPPGYTHDADFELASVNADHPGKGALTAFLDKYEPSWSLYIEHILERRLISFFENRGYRVIGTDDGLPGICMITARCRHYRDGRSDTRAGGATLPYGLHRARTPARDR